jgi:DNA helicase II / ATP-dependent DNA helicase PcrA
MHFEEDLERLNEYQKEAVLDDSGACVVNANVGSGKTTVLISKIIYLRYVKNVSYSDMIVLTFTNKAANEIKDRLISSDNNIKTEELLGFGTFHSVALNLLKDVLPVEEIGYSKGFLVIEPEEELDIAMQIIQEKKLRIKYKNRLKKRLEQAMSVRSEEQIISQYNDDILQLVQLLAEEKTKQNKMSFSDLLKNANTLLDGHKLEPEWIIIDEVQDSDKLQLEFIDKLKSANTRLFAVGDPNQVIYSWRGSSFNVFSTLMKKYAAKELSLPINYRSSSSILEAAKCFLQDGSCLTGIREPGSKIVVKSHYNPFNEACYIADRIRDLHDSGIPYNEIAVFYRLQNQSKVFEDVFSKNGIPHEVSLKKTIRDIPVLNWLIKLFRYSVNRNDLSSGIYVLSSRDYGEKMTEGEVGKIVKNQQSGQSELYAKMCRFPSLCAEVKNSEGIYNYFEFDKYIRPTSSAYKEDKESIFALLDIIIEYVKEKQMAFLDGLADFINSSALYGVNILAKDISSGADSVKLMTLHASKGLEFSHVFIAGVNYGLIPLQTRPMDEDDEERRLFFVGITRSKDYLELSYYTNPDYLRAMPGESRYISMIPSKLVQNDAVKSMDVNLQELKKQIQMAKASKNKEETVIKAENPTPVSLVSHQKYGKGKVLKEDEIMIEVKFENYGVKEFIKAFSELQYL